MSARDLQAWHPTIRASASPADELNGDRMEITTATASPSRLEQCYVLSPNEGAPQRSFCTQGDVRQAARLIPKAARHDARIMLVAYPVSKRHNVARRNGHSEPDVVLRKWRLTSRAALVEMPLDQD